MKLLFDQNLSFKLCERLGDMFPQSSQVRRAGMEMADDRSIWEFAKANGYCIVSQDADFADMAALYGAPPKVIWLRCGNQPTEFIAKLFRSQAEALLAFEQNSEASCWELY